MEEAPSSSSNWAFSLGIDVSKTALELALRDGGKTVTETTFANNSDGHEQLVRWLRDQGAGPEKTGVCMEASGDFEKAIAQRLYEEDYRVSVVNPRRIKGYASSQLQRTKTDSANGSLIARFGRREAPRPWEPASASESRLQELTRARQALKKEKTRTQNRLEEAEDEAVRKAHQNLLGEIERQIEDLENEIEEHIEEESELMGQYSLLETIPGIGLQTSAIVVSELGSPSCCLCRPRSPTQGVGHVRSRQTSNVEGPRWALAAGNVLSSNDGSSVQLSGGSFGDRLKERGKEKRVVIGAAMRKLLHICYGAEESGRPFDASLHPGT